MDYNTKQVAGTGPAPPEVLETDTNLETNNKTVSDLIWWEVINVKRLTEFRLILTYRNGNQS